MKKIALGTAMWGWSVDEKEAFSMLDHFYEQDGHFVDIATNYPINKDPSKFRFVERLVEKWLKAHMVNDLKLIVKVGAISNDGSPENNLTPENLHRELDHYLGLYSNSLYSFMIHWDNRDDESEIEKTIHFLNEEVLKQNLEIGLSGIKKVDLYYNLLANKECMIEAKSNFFESSLEHYGLFKQAKLFAYGINAGGVKLDEQYQKNSSLNLRGQTQKYQNQLDDYNQNILEMSQKLEVNLSAYDFNLMRTLENKRIYGIVVGPSKLNQLKNINQIYKHYYENYKLKLNGL